MPGTGGALLLRKPPVKPQLVITAAIGVGVFILLAAVAGAHATGESIGMFTRDTRTLAAEAGGALKFYAGAVSVLNGWVWASGAALAALAAWLVPARQQWLAVFALLLVALAADDSFMLHETVGPSQGVPDVAFYVVYAVAGGALLLRTLRRLRDSASVAFLAGGAFLALSIVADIALTDQFLLEDGGKLVGGLLWLTVPVLTFGNAARSAHQPARTVALDAGRRDDLVGVPGRGAAAQGSGLVLSDER